MSWAAMRETTRVEDMTYCLLGIFDVNLSLIYGEGGKKAFYRLQEAIATDTSDLSIFVWTDDRPTCPDFAPVLAESPRQFASSGNITVALEDSIYRDLTVTSRGIQVESSLLWFADHPDHAYRSVLDVFCRLGNESIGICIRKIGGGRYARHKPGMLAILGDKLQHRPWLDAHRLLVESLTLAPKLPSSYPFHSGNNPILGNRHLVLRLHWEPSSTRDWSVHHCRTMPRSHWDKHEDVFFAANSTTKGWAAFFVHGVLRNTPTTYIPVNLFLACFQWNIGPPNTVIAGLHDVEPSTAVLLESQLDRIRFESNRQARAMVHSVFDGKLKDRTAVLETAVIPIEGGNPQSPVLVSEWHSKSLHVGEKVNVEVTVDIGHEVCPELCVNPVIQLNVRVAVVK
ncbi:hypothetical protein B0H63DRAFT_465220 [Podospora didyma]|uniref:Vegetative incompatibility protein HET-E-1 n=1 Tax=Podospora didyma TaxID=330526 RepID=A0AAE0U448_9PEZI|nr:hypothetical protein B0H63DRAFT_465220 [Podospora didyma]